MKKLLLLAAIPLLLVSCNKENNDPVRFKELSFDKSHKVITQNGKTMKFQSYAEGSRVGRGNDDFFIYLSKTGGDFVFNYYVTKFDSVTLYFSDEIQNMPYDTFTLQFLEKKKPGGAVYGHVSIDVTEETTGDSITFNCPYVSKETGGCYFGFFAQAGSIGEREEYQIRSIYFKNVTLTRK